MQRILFLLFAGLSLAALVLAAYAPRLGAPIWKCTGWIAEPSGSSGPFRLARSQFPQPAR